MGKWEFPDMNLEDGKNTKNYLNLPNSAQRGGCFSEKTDFNLGKINIRFHLPHWKFNSN